VSATTPLSTLLSQALVAHTIELDNEFEHRFVAAGGGARVTSLTMWSNLLRFVGDGTTVGELVVASGLPRQHALSRLGGVERWRYVSVGPTGGREGYGSARGTKPEWMVRFTPAGERAAAIWPGLPAEIETRWRERFGGGAIDALLAVLREVDEETELALPDFPPVLSSTSAMVLELPTVETRVAPAELPLIALVAHALMAYTVDYEASAALSLPLSANVVRVLDDAPLPVRELPARTGISKEAVEVSLTSLKKTGYVVVEGAPASKRTIRLTPAGAEVRASERRLHTNVEQQWATASRLREALERVLDHPDLAAGLEPYPDGWRASKPYAQQTQAVLADPRGRLPHHPMVLHRGGWPDGS
jgi:DNA-binding MarR family transcriptional regulator